MPRAKRKNDEFRNLEITYGISNRAEGSALVKLGDSQVLAGVKMSVGTPFPDTPNEGVLMVGAELSPMASPTFESGPPDENAIQLARVVDRGIRESHCVDTEGLCIKEGEKVWIVNVDIYVIDHDGNLQDAAAIAAMAALKDAKIPTYNEETGKVDYENRTEGLPITTIPVSVTMARVNNELRVDPDLIEGRESDVQITITTDSDGNVVAVQKSKPGPMSFEEIDQAIEMSKKVGIDIRKKYFK